MSKTHWKKKFNYDYLGSYSITDGKDLILTIKEIKDEMVTGDKGAKEECVICYFAENQKPMILNRTNCKAIEKAYQTPFVEEWKGKQIQIYVAKVPAFGDMVDALRVRSKKPKSEKPELTPSSEKWSVAIDRVKTTGIASVEKFYRLSEANREKLITEAMNKVESNQLELK
jgi:CRISPR/Cas system CSM-associated protein Csm3 (group 7 of RAMP superfamily)